MSGYPPPGGFYPAPGQPSAPPYGFQPGPPAYPGAYPVGPVPPPGQPGPYPGGAAPAYPAPGAYPGGAAPAYLGQPYAWPGGAVPGGDRPPKEHCFYIQSTAKSLVLEVKDSGVDPGTPVVLAARNAQGQDKQLWFEDFATGTIKSRVNLLCLDVLEHSQVFHLERIPNQVPRDAICLARQTDATGQLYSAVAHTQWGTIPGKAKQGNCWYPYAGKEMVTNDFSWIVCPGATLIKNAGWPPPGALAVGHQTDATGTLYAGVARTKWGTIPGKAKENTCWYSYGGKELFTSDFDWVVPGGNAAVVGVYVPGKPNQLWVRSGDRIVNRNDGNKVLQVNDLNPGSGVTVAMPVNDQRQLWCFPGPGVAPVAPVAPIPSTGPGLSSRRYFFIRSELHGKVMDVDGENRSPGTAVIMYPRKPGQPAANQLWYQDEQRCIRSRLNDFALQPTANDIRLQPFNGSPNQRWVIQGKKIVNERQPNLCIDIIGQNREDGVRLCQYAYKGTPNQHWNFDYV